MIVDGDVTLESNFWTAFADLMLALVLVLCMLLFVIITVITLGTVDLKRVAENQGVMINSLAGRYGVQPVPLHPEVYGISTGNNGVYDIQIRNDLNSQRLSFSDKLLFEVDRTEINQKGQEVLDRVREVLLSQVSLIQEIQIQGHADTMPSSRFRNNTVLASERAIAVLEHLAGDKDLKIDRSNGHPKLDRASILMSATSFGEYKPVQRRDEMSNYTAAQLLADNDNETLKSGNRRIEIVLLYRR